MALTRYESQGVLIETGPGSTVAGSVLGSGSLCPCNGTRSLLTSPFTGPSILFRFPEPMEVARIYAGSGRSGRWR